MLAKGYLASFISFLSFVAKTKNKKANLKQCLPLLYLFLTSRYYICFLLKNDFRVFLEKQKQIYLLSLFSSKSIKLYFIQAPPAPKSRTPPLFPLALLSLTSHSHSILLLLYPPLSCPVAHCNNTPPSLLPFNFSSSLLPKNTSSLSSCKHGSPLPYCISLPTGRDHCSLRPPSLARTTMGPSRCPFNSLRRSRPSKCFCPS